MSAPRTATAEEWRFRRLAALYPTQWLAEHGDAYVGTMLDVADAEGRSRPAGRDWAAALRHVGTVWSAELRRRTRNDPGLWSFGVVGHAALGSGAALALLALVLGEWGPGWLLPGGPPAWWSDRPVAPTTGLVLFPCWLAALACVVAGRPTPARGLLRVAVPLPAVLYAVHAAGGPDRPPAGVLLTLAAFAVLALTAPAPGPVTRIVLAVAPAVAAAAAATCMLAAWAGTPEATGAPPLGSGLYWRYGFEVLAAPLFWTVVVVAAVALPLAATRPGLLLAVGLVGTAWLWLAMPTRLHLRPEDLLIKGTLAMGVSSIPGLLLALVATGLGVRRLRNR